MGFFQDLSSGNIGQAFGSDLTGSNSLVATVGNSLGQAGQKLINGVNNTINTVLKNPLPIIEATALSMAIGPEGFALVDTAGTAAALADAAATAINGGNANQILTSLAASQVGQYVGAQIGGSASAEAISQGLDKATADTIQNIVQSASAGATATAIKGGSFNQVLVSGFSGAVSAGIASQLKDQGITGLTAQEITNATNSATKALLNGQDIGTAITNSVKATTIAGTISAAKDELTFQTNAILANQDGYNKNDSLAKNLYNTQIKPLQDQLQQQYDILNQDKVNYANPNSVIGEQDQAVVQAQADQATKLENQLKPLQDQYNQYIANMASANSNINSSTVAVKADTQTIADQTSAYENQVTEDYSGITQQIADQAVKDAQAAITPTATTTPTETTPTETTPTTTTTPTETTPAETTPTGTQGTDQTGSTNPPTDEANTPGSKPAGTVTNPNGTITQTFDDGSTLTLDGQGNVISTTNATDTNNKLPSLVIPAVVNQKNNTPAATTPAATVTTTPAVLTTSDVKNLTTSDVSALTTSGANGLSFTDITKIISALSPSSGTASSAPTTTIMPNAFNPGRKEDTSSLFEFAVPTGQVAQNNSPIEAQRITMASTGGSIDDLLKLLDWKE